MTTLEMEILREWIYERNDMKLGEKIKKTRELLKEDGWEVDSSCKEGYIMNKPHCLSVCVFDLSLKLGDTDPTLEALIGIYNDIKSKNERENNGQK